MDSVAFDPLAHMPQTGGVIVLTGRRGQGKTTTIKHMLYHRAVRGVNLFEKDAHVTDVLTDVLQTDVAQYVAKLVSYRTFYQAGLIMSDVESATHAYEGLVPPDCIHTEYDANVLHAFIVTQCEHVERAILAFRQAHEGRPPEGDEWVAIRTQHRAFVVFDSIFADVLRQNHDHMIRELFMHCRFCGIDVFISMPWIFDLTLMLLGQVDVVFFFQTLQDSVKHKWYNHYFSFFETYAGFLAFFHEHTTAWGSVVLRNTSNIHQALRTYRARQRPWLALGIEHRPNLLCRFALRELQRKENLRGE